MNPYLALKSGTDARGKAMGEGAAMNGEAARRLGGAFVLWLSRRRSVPPESMTIALGRDSRLTGEALLSACAQGVLAAGAKCVDYGLCTTPAMYMAILTEGYKPDATIMVTASHLPYDRNGLKFFTPAGGLESADMDELLTLAGEIALPDAPHGALPKIDFLSAYQGFLSSLVREKLSTDDARPLLGLHVLVDAGSGAGGFYAKLLEDLGAWIEGSQYLEPDGRFPGHIPNPEAPEAMKSVSSAVIKAGADLGVIFDADCDRAAIVDQTGREINRNRLIALVSAILLDKSPGATIVTDSVTSSGLNKFITEWDGVHYRFKRGYRNVIDEAKRLNAAGIDCPLAMETSGHAALRDNHFLDDGMYLSTLLICEALKLKRQGKLLSSLIDDLQEPEESVEIRLPILCDDFRAAGKAVIEKVMDYATFAGDCRVASDNREGVRINFDLNGGYENGWFLLRLSLHDPVLPLNAESDVKGGVRRMLSSLMEALKGETAVDVFPIQNYLGKGEN